MTGWQLASTPPQRAGRYAIAYSSGTWVAGNWSPDRGWTDGLNRINCVKWWCELPPLPHKRVGAV